MLIRLFTICHVR